MKTSRDVAIDVVQKVCGGGFSRATLVTMIADDSDTGRFLKQWADTIEKAVEQDRKVRAAMVAPS